MNSFAPISAAAAFRLNRDGASSLFRAPLDELLNNPKAFLANPATVSRAVAQLKHSGFQVTYVDRMSLGIIGSKQLYETSFSVTLVKRNEEEDDLLIDVYDVENSSGGLIDTDNSTFADVLDGIALFRPSSQQSAIPPSKTKPWYIYPSEISSLLGGELTTHYPETDGILVGVIDTGVEIKHDHFKALGQTDVTAFQSERLDGEYRALLDQVSSNKGEFDEATWARYQFVSNFFNYPDGNGHGTAVISNLLAVNPSAKLFLINDDLTKISLSAFKELLVHQPKVINLSIRSYLRREDVSSVLNTDEFLKPFLTAIAASVRKGTVIVFCSGNSDAQANTLSIYNFLEEIISVGGAYKNQNGELVASNIGHGYPDTHFEKFRAIPDVVGLVGPDEEGGINYVPQYKYEKVGNGDPSEWERQDGTSYAAPQVTALCAFVKAACPSATPVQIKEILMRTSTQIVDNSSGNKTFHNYYLQQIKHTIGEDEISPGLVNIALAVLAARIFNYYLIDGEGKTIKQAVERAKGILKK